ncbi:hypothetical protein MIB92_01925 [Aestuariirhabdus sp. Z084]|uniref:hypothetical protein n=1 Tax=Aestuariirhabdus haliotis TaxID=2918751 RepID=UPI00201B3C73|nr:hypothetical protein [Aestuariirhabdus haliotis]MCL6414397.1 hypothetical protein [Aestuariirhabdus haliotis]MCL6418329.1 hypothetical protein [Aestuariirhabdus haliotis]
MAEITSRIINWKSLSSISPDCQEQLSQLSQPVSEMPKLIAESRRFNVVDDEQRAQAFMALSGSVGITIVAAQVAMTAMTSFSSVML